MELNHSDLLRKVRLQVKSLHLSHISFVEIKKDLKPDVGTEVLFYEGKNGLRDRKKIKESSTDMRDKRTEDMGKNHDGIRCLTLSL